MSASRLRAAERRGFDVETGAPIEIGAIEKMSKSKKNVVDPDDIIASYGADTARWFMLSDSPPDRDVIWTDEGVQGAARFVQRLWRLLERDRRAHRRQRRRTAPDQIGEAAQTLRKASAQRAGRRRRRYRAARLQSLRRPCLHADQRHR